MGYAYESVAPCRRYRRGQRVVRLVRDGVSALLGGGSCLCCGGAVSALPLCGNCARSLCAFPPLFVAERCRVCGKPLLSEIGCCMECRSSPVLRHTDGVFPLHGYRLWKKALLHAWKTEHERTLSPLFAAVCYRALQELYAQVGACLPVVPIPPRPGKIRRTGWDQIAELCAHLRRGYGVALSPLLCRRSRTQQKKLGRAGRLHSLGSAYALSRFARRLRLRARLPPAVVLVDDVLTTGATLETCAQVLKAAGVERVYAVTLFGVD